MGIEGREREKRGNVMLSPVSEEIPMKCQRESTETRVGAIVRSNGEHQKIRIPEHIGCCCVLPLLS